MPARMHCHNISGEQDSSAMAAKLTNHSWEPTVNGNHLSATTAVTAIPSIKLASSW